MARTTRTACRNALAARTAYKIALAKAKTKPKKRPHPPDDEDWTAYQSVKRSRPSDSADAVVKVVVGEEKSAKQSFFHQERLTKHSEFCSAALSSRWLEGWDSIIRLPTDDPTLFAIFSKFIYTGEVESHLDDQTFDDNGVLVGDMEYERLIALWVLGDKLMSQTFQDGVLDRLTEKLDENNMFPTDFHQKVYPITAGANGLRRLAVDVALFWWPEDALAKAEMDESWNEFFKDVAVRATGRNAPKKGMAPFGLSTCAYHDHGEEVCNRKMF